MPKQFTDMWRSINLVKTSCMQEVATNSSFRGETSSFDHILPEKKPKEKSDIDIDIDNFASVSPFSTSDATAEAPWVK